jgi:hypothetical protein
MTKRPPNPWYVERVEPSAVERLTAKHEPNPEAVAQGVDLVGDPHREDDNDPIVVLDFEEASQPTLDEVLDRAGGRAGGSVTLKAAVRSVRADRGRP